MKRFSESLSDRFEVKSRFESQGTAAVGGDVDFVGQAEASRGDAADLNMEKLNLFGVALTTQEESELGREQDTARDKEHRRKFVADLIDVLCQVDDEHELRGLGGAQDLDQPKSLFHFDPYGQFEGGHASVLGSFDQQLTALQYEDRLKLRASIIIDTYAQQIQDIDASKLTLQEKDTYEKVTNLLNYLQNVKIVDAPVLLKIYNLHRCKM